MLWKAVFIVKVFKYKNLVQNLLVKNAQLRHYKSSCAGPFDYCT